MLKSGGKSRENNYHLLDGVGSVLGGVGRCWEVLGGVGRCWEVFLFKACMRAPIDSNMRAEKK